MYSRFLTWQGNPYLSADTQSVDVNQFTLTDIATDIRFRLKGYGFKKVGEQNRLVYHFGCYQCFYRKVGDIAFIPFAHVQSERADSEDADVYADVFAASGVLGAGQYEVKVVACKLVEFATWGGGVVEGIASGDKFYYDLSARQNVPQRVRVIDNVTIEESAEKGFDPFYLMAGDAFEDILQTADISSVYVETEVNIVEAVISVSETVTVIVT